MIFNQFGFLFLFLPIVLVLHTIPSFKEYRVYLLLAASFLFYGLSGVEHAIVLAADILWVYFVIRSDKVVGNKVVLALAIIPPFLALIYYKYLGFLVASAIQFNPPEDTAKFDLFANIILPAGISFFTFQIVAFAIDKYRGSITWTPPLFSFALYISFFPQLVAGPIVRFDQIQSALADLVRFKLSSDDLSTAIGHIVIGLALKVLIADNLSTAIEPFIGTGDVRSLGGSVFVFVAYSFQIYFDFFGYSLIAIGLGRLFGFRLPVNFMRPYSSLNPRDFWRRWHISLSYWIRDYLYISLGGNRSYLKNIIIVFAIMGLWHGAGWNFVAWGLYHAGLVLVYHFLQTPWDRLPRQLQICLNFLLISIGWLFFLFNIAELQLFLSGITFTGLEKLKHPGLEDWTLLAIGAFVCFGPSFDKTLENGSNTFSRDLSRNATLALIFIACLMFLDRSQTFIYFRF